MTANASAWSAAGDSDDVPLVDLSQELARESRFDPGAMGVDSESAWRAIDAERESIYLAAERYYAAQIAEIGRERFLDEVAGRGRAEGEVWRPLRSGRPRKLGKFDITSVGGEPVINVVHYGSGLGFVHAAFEFAAAPRAPLALPMRQYLALKHLRAGRTQADGSIDWSRARGRDLVLVDRASIGAPVRAYRAAPRPRGLARIGAYLTAVIRKPTEQHVLFLGLVPGLAQGAITWGLGWASTGSASAANVVNGALFAAAFGTVVGSFSATYRLIVEDPSKFQQFLKALPLSLAFAYGLHVVNQHGEWSSLNVYDPSGFLGFLSLSAMEIHAQKWLNSTINQYVKTEWNQILRVLGELRELVGRVTIFGRELKISKADVAQQQVQLAPFTFKSMDLLPLGEVGELPILGSISVGKLLFYSSKLIALSINLAYYERRAAGGLNQARWQAILERSQRELRASLLARYVPMSWLTAPAHALNGAARAVTTAWESACSALLGRNRLRQRDEASVGVMTEP